MFHLRIGSNDHRFSHQVMKGLTFGIKLHRDQFKNPANNSGEPCILIECGHLSKRNLLMIPCLKVSLFSPISTNFRPFISLPTVAPKKPCNKTLQIGFSKVTNDRLRPFINSGASENKTKFPTNATGQNTKPSMNKAANRRKPVLVFFHLYSLLTSPLAKLVRRPEYGTSTPYYIDFIQKRLASFTWKRSFL